MFLPFTLVFVSLTTIIHCQNVTDNTSRLSSCFKDLSIYKSNSPHVIQKKDDLVCVSHESNADTNKAYYQNLINKEIDSSVLPRSLNIDNSVSLPSGTAANLSIYQIGTSVFRYISSTNITTYYSLPVKLFNSPTCSGSQPITYLNDFTSTCSQPVNQQTCNTALDTTKYINNFCLVTLPSTLAGNNPTTVCCNYAGLSSSWTSGTCTNSLQNLNLIISYSNPNGIVNCSIIFNTTTGSTSSPVSQTFSVRFVKAGSPLSSIANSGNPGYIQGAPIIAGNLAGSIINRILGLTVLQTSTGGVCSTASNQLITFGKSVQSTCLTTTCPNINDPSNIFASNNSTNLYVAIYGNSNIANTTNWLPVTFCISEIGSTSGSICQENSVPSAAAGQCYIRLDIQIVYANYGSVTNPQPILGAVIYHFQSVTTTSATPVLMTQTITFQDMSNAPATQGDQIPRPNTRLPGDFFYPFTLNRAANPALFSFVFYLLIFSLLFLM